MTRGEVWTVAAGTGYAGKPRPAVILQSDRFDATASITVCLLTSDPLDLPLIRPLIEPDAGNGLREPSRLMADKLVSLPKTKLGRCLGRLDREDLIRLNRAVTVFLGLAD